jgi:hypothetical protein
MVASLEFRALRRPSPSLSPSPQETEPEPFPTTWLSTIGIIAIGGAAFTLYCFTKNRKTTLKTEKLQVILTLHRCK